WAGRLVKEGDFESAGVLLVSVAQRLDSEAGQTAQAAVAHLYLGIAQLEQDQVGPARSEFREALVRHDAMRLDARDFSPQVIRIFEAVRGESKKEAVVPPLAGGGGGGAGPRLLYVAGLA